MIVEGDELEQRPGEFDGRRAEEFALDSAELGRARFTSGRGAGGTKPPVAGAGAPARSVAVRVAAGARAGDPSRDPVDRGSG